MYLVVRRTMSALQIFGFGFGFGTRKGCQTQSFCFFFQISTNPRFDSFIVIYGVDLAKLDYFYQDDVTCDVTRALSSAVGHLELFQITSNPRFDFFIVIYGVDLVKLDYFHEDIVTGDVKWPAQFWVFSAILNFAQSKPSITRSILV